MTPLKIPNDNPMHILKYHEIWPYHLSFIEAFKVKMLILSNTIYLHLSFWHHLYPHWKWIVMAYKTLKSYCGVTLHLIHGIQEASNIIIKAWIPEKMGGKPFLCDQNWQRHGTKYEYELWGQSLKRYNIQNAILRDSEVGLRDKYLIFLTSLHPSKCHENPGPST